MTDPKKKIVNILKGLIPYVIIILIVLFIRAFIVIPIRVNGDSMAPTLVMNEFMILNRMAYRTQEINRFDIIVIQYNDRPLIKRVIGLPGERVEFRDNKLFINDNEEPELFDREETEDFNIEELGFDTVPPNQYFVVGDNRPNSVDSRQLGFFNRGNIIGKANFVIFPVTDWGTRK